MAVSATTYNLSANKQRLEDEESSCSKERASSWQEASRRGSLSQNILKKNH